MSTGAVIDFSIVAIALIAVIFGFKKGFTKQFTTFGATVGAFIVSFILAGVVTNLLLYSKVVMDLSERIGGWFSGIPGATDVITSPEQLVEALSQSNFAVFANIADSMWEGMKYFYTDTIANYFGYLILQAVFMVVIFVLGFTFISNLFKALRSFMESFTDVSSVAGIDRLLGAVWALFITYVFVIGVGLTALEILSGLYLPKLQLVVLVLINESSLLSFAHNTNFIGALLANIFGFSLPELPTAVSLLF